MYWLDELDKLEKEATPGPWDTSCDCPSSGIPCAKRPDGTHCHLFYDYEYGPRDGADADLFIALRNRARELIDASKAAIGVCRKCGNTRCFGVVNGHCFENVKLRDLLRRVSPLVTDELSKIQEFSCDHDEYCTCDREAKLLVIQDELAEVLK